MALRLRMFLLILQTFPPGLRRVRRRLFSLGWTQRIRHLLMCVGLMPLTVSKESFMAVDPVPYVVHGAKHSADVFRQAFHDSTGGAEGISTPTSFHVRQTATPSNQVRVRPGGAIVLNSYQGGAGQSYGIRNA